MATRYDLALVNNDLYIDPVKGDFVIAQSDEQHIADTINAFPGWWIENPLDGVGIYQYSHSPVDIRLLNRAITDQLNADGYSLNTPIVSLAFNNLIINPNINKP